MDKIRKPPISYSSGKPIRKRGRKPGLIRTSKANAKRTAEGLQRVKGDQYIATGHASDIARKAPLASSEARAMASKAITLSPELKPMLIAKFQSAEQRVMAELRQSLIESSPRAAAYLADVVDGLHESAPHSVRVQAAISKIGLAIQFTQESPEIKDLHSMGVSDLEASLQSLGRELASRTAEDVEVIEEPKHG